MIKNFFYLIALIYLGGVFVSTFLIYKENKASKQILVIAYFLAIVLFLAGFFLFQLLI